MEAQTKLEHFMHEAQNNNVLWITRLEAQLAEFRAWYPKVLPFSTEHVTCLKPAVGGLK